MYQEVEPGMPCNDPEVCKSCRRPFGKHELPHAYQDRQGVCQQCFSPLPISKPQSETHSNGSQCPANSVTPADDGPLTSTGPQAAPSPANPDALELNESQRRAATSDHGHALVLAGAGCGKTKTIIARCEHLIACGVPAHQICVLAFTRRAAAEIAARVNARMGQQAKGLHASTFHSFCMLIINQHPQWFGSAGWTVIDRDEQIDLLNLIRHQRRDGLPSAETLIDIHSFARNTLCDLSTATSNYHESHEGGDPCLPHEQEIALIFRQYEARKRSRHYLDYDDILDIIANQLQNRPDVRRLITSRYSHIIVDEFQDTNALQWKLLDQFKDSVSLFCVGDDAQSIYGFRGADFRMIHSFQDRVPGATKSKLEDNYRSTQEILDLSNWVLEQSPLRYEKKLRAVRGPGPKPRILNFTDTWDEASWIANDLLARHRNGAKWNRHMILVRSAWSARFAQKSLIENTIPYRFIGGTHLFAAAHVKDVLSILRVAANVHDELGWVRYLKLWPTIGEKTATALANQLLEKGTPTEALACLASADNQIAAGDCRTLLESCAAASTPLQALATATSGLEPLLAKRYHKDWPRRTSDFTILEKLAQTHSSLTDFISECVLNPVYETEMRGEPTPDAVTLITVHSAKGTEADVCYIVDASPGSWPHNRALSGGNPETRRDKVEEERRVLYVALTRARKVLTLTRTWFGANARLGATPATDEYFLAGIPPELVSEETAAALPPQAGRDAGGVISAPMTHIGIITRDDLKKCAAQFSPSPPSQ